MSCVRKSDSANARESDNEKEKERVGEYQCVLVWVRERARDRVCVTKGERVCMLLCTYVVRVATSLSILFPNRLSRTHVLVLLARSDRLL